MQTGCTSELAKSSETCKMDAHQPIGIETMEKKDIATRLMALASDDSRRSETARLRDIFEDVERTLKAGVQQDDVLAELHKAGFKMTKTSFKSALLRIRKERLNSTPQVPTTTPKPQNLDDIDNANKPLKTSGGKLKSEQVLETPNKSFSYKKLQQQKD